MGKMKKVVWGIMMIIILCSVGVAYTFRIYTNTISTMWGMDIADDTVGDVRFSGTCSYGGTCDITSGNCIKVVNCDSPPAGNNLVIYDVTGGITAWISNIGGFCTEGSIGENTGGMVCGSGQLCILDRVGTTIFALKGEGGGLAVKGTIRCGVFII
jgi:hypothetical protein